MKQKEEGKSYEEEKQSQEHIIVSIWNLKQVLVDK